MASRHAGLRTTRQAWKNPLYGKAARPLPKPPTPEELAEREVQREAFNQRFLAEMESRSQQRVLAKLVDKEARVAVEGDASIHQEPFGGEE